MSEYKFKTKPYDHQLTALKKGWDKEYYAYFMEMGTGKSKVLIDEIASLYLRGKITAALIVAPKGVYRNWEKGELPIHMPNDIPVQIAAWKAPSEMNIQDKKSLKDILYPNGKLRILLMNIEAFSGTKGVRYAAQFLHKADTLMAIDESTTIKTPTAARTKNVLKIGKLAKYQYGS